MYRYQTHMYILYKSLSFPSSLTCKHQFIIKPAIIMATPDLIGDIIFTHHCITNLSIIATCAYKSNSSVYRATELYTDHRAW